MIDPNILLQSRPVQVQTALDAQTQAANLGNMQNQGQLQQGQLAMQPGALVAQGQENQQRQDQIDTTKVVNDAYAAAFKPDPAGGPPKLDINALQTAIATHNKGAALPGIVDAYQKSQTAQQTLLDARAKTATAQDDAYGATAQVISKAGNHPATFLAMAQDLLNNQTGNPATLTPAMNQVKQALAADPTGASAIPLVKSFTDGAITKSAEQQKQIAAAQTAGGAAQRGQAATDDAALLKQKNIAQQRGSTLGQATDQPSWDAATLAMGRQGDDLSKIPATFSPAAAASYANAGKTPAEISTEAQGAATAAETKLRDANAVSHGNAELHLQAMRIQQENANRESVSLTPEARDQMATYFATTGQLPNLGMGAAVAKTRADIINRAAAMFPNVTFASNAANFQANKSSLKNVQGTLDTLTAFENTGLKNMKLFTDAAASIPDTGVPWLNTPIRLLDEKLVGSANMAVVNAARNVQSREIARVTNDPKLSGVLSDSSRHETQELSPTNATLPQILAVAKMMQTDMANVHSSLSDQRDAINNRISVNPTGGNAAGAPAAAPGAAVLPHIEAARKKYNY